MPGFVLISDHALPAGVLKGIEQFNAGAFYECHGSIELEWVVERGDVRRLLMDVERCEAEMRELGPERLGEFNRFPTIRVNR